MKNILSCMLLMVSGCLAGLFYITEKDVDRSAPVIAFPQEQIVYEENGDQEILLQGVRAVDDVDGDVSDSLVVESVLPMKDGVSATVLYYARDNSGNVAKTSRIVEYQPEGGIPWQEVEETEAEETERETETGKQECPADGHPYITLKTDRVVVKAGESYKLLSYVEDIVDDEDGDDWLYRQIHIEGAGSIAGPGEYELYYSVVDRQWNQSNKAKLTLVIE